MRGDSYGPPVVVVFAYKTQFSVSLSRDARPPLYIIDDKHSLSVGIAHTHTHAHHPPLFCVYV